MKDDLLVLNQAFNLSLKGFSGFGCGIFVCVTSEKLVVFVKQHTGIGGKNETEHHLENV